MYIIYHRVVAYPFNFYIYPLAVGSHNSKRFGFHTGSMSFLAKNNFDFNKLFYDGVPYVCKEKGNIDRQK